MRLLFLCALLFLYSCKKEPSLLSPVATPADASGFVKYTIKQGSHYADQNKYQAVKTDVLQFRVRFDSSAVYQSASSKNQYDINKLFGFSDNGAAHHLYSVRFGWRWSGGALRLFGYVYNNGKMISEELGVVPVGAEIRCRIAVTPEQYLFYCNEQVRSLPRKSTTAKGKGYLLYPYFGGDETAPHDVAIWIKKE